MENEIDVTSLNKLAENGRFLKYWFAMPTRKQWLCVAKRAEKMNNLHLLFSVDIQS